MPATTVCAILTRQQGNTTQVLLARRAYGPFKGQWCLPGGHIEPYEPLVQAVRREIKEETGLDFQPQFFGCFDEIMPQMCIHAVVVAYEGQGVGELQAQPEEVSEIGWFALPEAQNLQLAFQHNHILETYAARKPQ